MDIKIKIECPDLTLAAEMISRALAAARCAAYDPGKPETTTPEEASEPVAAPAPVAAPVAATHQITIDQIGKAGADLLSKNPAAMPQLMALLQKYGVQSAQQLKPEQIVPFATEMRALGAVI